MLGQHHNIAGRLMPTAGSAGLVLPQGWQCQSLESLYIWCWLFGASHWHQTANIEYTVTRCVHKQKASYLITVDYPFPFGFDDFPSGSSHPTSHQWSSTAPSINLTAINLKRWTWSSTFILNGGAMLYKHCLNFKQYAHEAAEAPLFVWMCDQNTKQHFSWGWHYF